MDLGLSGKVVFISGASRGIGLAVARSFLAEGARVALTARGAEELAAAGAELKKLGEATTIAADMTDEADIARALDETRRALGPIDAVVANLGSGASIPGYAISAAEWQRTAMLNLVGATVLAGRAIDLLAQRAGSLTFVSSIAGLEAVGAPPAYAAAKAGLNAAMKCFSREAAPLGVRINAVAPGNVMSPGGTWERKVREDPKAVEDMLRREVAMGRLAKPEEIADVVVFLASARASFVTGSVWVVDGGQTRAF